MKLPKPKKFHLLKNADHYNSEEVQCYSDLCRKDVDLNLGEKAGLASDLVYIKH